MDVRTGEIVGHRTVLALLGSSIQKDALSHAYLLAGPPRVWKMTVAKWLAQALNCKEAERACGKCSSCQKIAAGRHSDVQVIDIKGNTESDSPTEIGIKQIQDAQHVAALPPFEGSCKVFIIDSAEQMSPDAQNCLLKTLEEPARSVVFVLLTSAASRLLPTVISRCQRLELRPAARGDIETALVKQGADAGKAALLARLSHGCYGWALSASQSPSLLEERQQEVASILDTINAGYEERFDYASRLAAKFGKSRESAQEVLALWLDWWRDILLVKTGCAAHITNIDRQDSVAQMSGACRIEQVRSFIEMVRAAAVQLRQNVNPRLVLEVLMLGIPEMQNA